MQCHDVVTARWLIIYLDYVSSDPRGFPTASVWFWSVLYYL